MCWLDMARPCPTDQKTWLDHGSTRLQCGKTEVHVKFQKDDIARISEDVRFRAKSLAIRSRTM